MNNEIREKLIGLQDELTYTGTTNMLEVLVALIDLVRQIDCNQTKDVDNGSA